MTDTVMRRAFVLALGAGVGPMFQLLATPWLARLYLPADFGHLALFMSVAGVLVSVSCLRYEVAVAVVDEDRVSSAVWVSVGSGLLLFLMLLFAVSLHGPQLLFPQLEGLGREIWGVPVFGVCGGLVLVGMQLTLRRAAFALNAALRSGQTVLFVLLALFCADLGLVKTSILSGLVVGVLVILYLLKEAPLPGIAELRRVAWGGRQYPLVLMPTSMLDAVALAAPVFFISSAYGAEATGHYSQIQKLVGGPLILTAVVAGQLFLKRSGEIYRSAQSSKRLLWKSVGVLGVMAGIVFAALVVVGEYVLGLLLGAAWRVDTEFLLLAIAPLLFRLTVSPVSSVFITHHRVGMVVKWQFGYFVSTICVLYFASINLSFERFLALYALHEAVVYSAYLYMANLAAQSIRKM
jgi:O-antigen/teichoic acid export membrane protein